MTATHPSTRLVSQRAAQSLSRPGFPPSNAGSCHHRKLAGAVLTRSSPSQSRLASRPTPCRALLLPDCRRNRPLIFHRCLKNESPLILPGRLERAIFDRESDLLFAAVRHLLDRCASVLAEHPELARPVMLVLKGDQKHSVADQLESSLQPL